MFLHCQEMNNFLQFKIQRNTKKVSFSWMHPLVVYIMCKYLASTKENLYEMSLGWCLEPEANWLRT